MMKRSRWSFIKCIISGAEGGLDKALNFLAEQCGAEGLRHKQRGGFKAVMMTDGELATGAEDDDGNLTRSGIFFEFCQSFLPVHFRHEMIQQDDAGLFTACDGESFTTICGRKHGMAERHHAELCDSADVWLVINDEDGFSGGHG